MARVALVTGGTRGIGRATALALARADHDVAVLFAHDVERAEKTCIEVEAAGGRALAVLADVGDPAAVDAAFSQVEASFGPVTVLVCNAGVTRDGLLLRMRDEQWSAVMRTNLDGAFHSIRRAVPGMLKAKWGRIVTVGSVVGMSPNRGQANYAAAKAGLIGLTRTVAAELASRGITVNTVSPGPISTSMTDALPDAKKAEMAAQVPLGRFGHPDEVAAVISFLCSDSAGYVTGAIVPVDGGMGMGH